jgi:outer membrane protein
LSRNGLEDPLIDAVEVVPLDRIQVPEKEELPPLREMVASAMLKRPDVALSQINDQTADISALGTANGVLPTLQTITSFTDSGLSGVANRQPNGATADPYYVGGLGNGLAQVFRHNFPNRRQAVLFQGAIGNRIAQGDYGIDQLQLRQGDLVSRKNMNQLVVDISNQVVALRQARARYSQAVDTRALQEQLLEKEQQKFTLGSATIDSLITAQRSLAAAQSAEVATLANYARARTSLDQVLGETLEKNRVSVDDGLQGHVAHHSRLPEGTTAAAPSPAPAQ